MSRLENGGEPSIFRNLLGAPLHQNPPTFFLPFQAFEEGGSFFLNTIAKSIEQEGVGPFYEENRTPKPYKRHLSANDTHPHESRVPLIRSTCRTLPSREKATPNSATIVRSKLDQGFPPEHVGRDKVGAATSMPPTRERR